MPKVLSSWLKHVCLLTAAVVSLVAPHHAATQEAVELVSTTGEIPRGSYKSWSLFLICNPDWVFPERSGDLANLYRRFKAFGDAIGRENLAVWFWKSRVPISDPRLSENVDVARGADYCGALGLEPSKGPYLLVTTQYPSLSSFPKERAIFQLGGLQPAQLATLLNTLTDQLLLNKRLEDVRIAARPEPNSSAPEPQVPSIWIRLLESTRQSMIGLGCAVNLKVDTGLLSAELRACKGP